MGDMREMFKMMNTEKKARKERNLIHNMAYLNGGDIDYEVFNNGYHLKIKSPFGVYGVTVDFYPSTNKWVFNGKTYFGTAEDLIKWFRRRITG